MATSMKMFIEIFHGNKWCYIGKINYVIPKDNTSPITCLAQGELVDRNYLLNYIISGYNGDFAKSIGGVQLIDRREVPTSGKNKCSKYILNTLDYDVEYDSFYNDSYVLLSELFDIAKLEPFNLHGYIHSNPSKYSIMMSVLPQIICDGVFDITNWVVSTTEIENCDEEYKKYNYKFMNFQSKCVTHFIEQIKDTIKSYVGSDIFDKENNIMIPPENIRIIFWYDE